MLLDATTHTLEVVTSTTAATDVAVTYADHTTTAFTPASGSFNITTATSTTVVAAPAASTQRQIKYLSITNISASSVQTVIVRKDISGAKHRFTGTITLKAGESVVYVGGGSFVSFDNQGRVKNVPVSQSPGSTGYPVYFAKTGTAPEAAGNYYSWAKDGGLPGAWAYGTPGLNGRATDGTAAGDVGCLTVPNAASGSNYLVGLVMGGSTTKTARLVDYLWVNSGYTITQTTVHAITPVAIPARDANGTTNGVGVFPFLHATSAVGNAGAVSTITLTYTNSAGTAGRTASMTTTQWPATPVIGHVGAFTLQAGDVGVRSVEGVTFGTSLVSGTVSLVLARVQATAGVVAANVSASAPMDATGIRLYSGTCLHLEALATGAVLDTIQGVATVVER